MLKRILLLSFFTLTVFSSSCKSQQDSTEQKIEKKGDPLEELMTLEDNEYLVATMATNMGLIEIELFAQQAPVTVKNFAGLANKGFYDSISFHRVIKQFMIQGGDPTGTGAGGESYYGHTFEDEFDPALQHDGAGILSMANRGPNTNTSQFFITLVPTPWLNGKHTVFGKVISGLEVVEAIGEVETANDKPIKPVIMEKVTVEKRSR